MENGYYTIREIEQLAQYNEMRIAEVNIENKWIVIQLENARGIVPLMSKKIRIHNF